MLKLRQINPVDYPVMALEGLWGVPGFDRATFDITNPSGWEYTLLVMQPDLITPDLFQEGLAQIKKKRGSQPTFDRLGLESFEEGLSIQIMHIGPYATEMATIARMDAFAEASGYQMVGRHHEIYLSDPRRTEPEKLKTVLRHPVAKN
jgi:hypothetical protein